MPQPSFTDLPLYSYISGQDNLIQYNIVRNAAGTVIVNDRFSTFLTNTSSYYAIWLNSVPVSRVDYDLNTDLCRDIGTGLTTTFCQFATHYRESLSNESDVTNIVIDMSVESYNSDDQNDDPTSIISTYKSGSRATVGTSYMCIFSGTAKVRS